jgi:HPt (histidine-containing phosphotransfer) domain-containing protein
MAAEVDTAALQRLAGLTTETGDDLMGAMIELFGANTPAAVATLRELSARPRESAPMLERTAHTLKGAAATLGAVEIADLARTVEDAARTGARLEIAPILARIDERLAPVLRTLRAERVRLLGRHEGR